MKESQKPQQHLDNAERNRRNQRAVFLLLTVLLGGLAYMLAGVVGPTPAYDQLTLGDSAVQSMNGSDWTDLYLNETLRASARWNRSVSVQPLSTATFTAIDAGTYNLYFAIHPIVPTVE
jgi:hypothetical protein